MAKSLRWRLQIWHAVILSIVVTVFGSILYLQIRRGVLEEIDSDLLANARVLEGVLRSRPPETIDKLLPSIKQLEEQNERNAVTSENPTDFALPSSRLEPPESSKTRWLEALSLPDPRKHGPHDRDSMLEREPMPDQGDRPSQSYFAIFRSNGQLLRASMESDSIPWELTYRPIEYRVRDSQREVLLKGPRNTLIIVGRDVRRDWNRLLTWFGALVSTGLGLLVFGLIGGWWLSDRATRPIQKINATAERINANNLSEQIDVSKMDLELSQLGSILNSMWARLHIAFQQQTQFTADASHELRTPVAVMLSHCDLALSRPRSQEEYVKTIMTCKKSAERMKSLVEDLLLLARADANCLSLQLVRTPLRLMMQETIALLEPLAQKKGVQVTLMGEDFQWVLDPSRMSQVFTNLLKNAIDYNRQSGTVRILLVRNNDECRIRFEDSGVGIPADSLPLLFHRFYRVDEARSRESGGSGLGLSICKSIVEAHQGTFKVTSQSGIGSVFELRLPKLSPDDLTIPTI